MKLDDYRGYIIRIYPIDGGFTYRVTRNGNIYCSGTTYSDTLESIVSKIKEHLDIRIFSDETGE
jgi:hypothetical protein